MSAVGQHIELVRASYALKATGNDSALRTWHQVYGNVILDVPDIPMSDSRGSSSPICLVFLYSFGMSIRVGSHELTVTEASQRGVAGLVADAEQGADVVVTRHRRPVAVVVAYHRLEELAQAAEDLRDLALVLARSADDVGKRTSLDDVLRAFGHDRESLAALPDDE